MSLPDVNLRQHFTAAQLDAAAEYERFLRIDFLLSQLALLVVLGLYAWRGARLARESAAGRIGTGMMLGMLGLALVWLVQLPFAVAEHWWRRRHDLSELGYLEYVFGGWLGLGGAFLFISLALLIVMGFAQALRDRWWAAGAPAFVGLALLFAFVFPYLVPADPLEDPALEAEAREIAREVGTEPVPIKVESVGEVTTAPNAFTTGIGSSRQVFLWDTLLDGRFDDDEIVVVLAHELAHAARHHVVEGVGWYALFAIPGAFLIAVATRRYGGLAEPRAVPPALLVLVVLQLAALPLQSAISRRMEVEADWIALEATRDPDAARDLFRAFTTTALAHPSPPTWSYLLLGGHPTIEQRLALVEAWRARRRG